jgi:hypothetical protein
MADEPGNHEPEIRFGLVLYGGVALAVYIYGVVVEVQRLLRASAAVEGDGPSPGYAEALATAGVSRVSVDVISGTSAGGINGILLAKAIATGADVESVRDLWLKGGDIAALMHRLGDKGPKSLLRRDFFEERLGEGFEKLEEPASEPDSDGALDLFVSSTHIRGNRRQFIDALGRPIPTLLHRYVFRLKLRCRYGHDDFSNCPGDAEPGNPARANDRLVKLARATSAFPVAFEPVRIDPSDHLLGPHDEPSGWFADGGILNNKPFTDALGAIFTRSSDRAVRRWLLSVDPDPEAVAMLPAPGPEPAFDQIALGAVAKIPRYQSIAGDLETLEAHNAAVRRIADATLDLEAELAEQEPQLPDPSLEGQRLAGFAFGNFYAYRNLRARAWAEEIADQLMLAVRFASPEDEALEAIRADFVEAALARIPVRDDRLDADLAYERRRAYYLIKLLSLALEPGPGSPGLNRVRTVLWEAFERVSRVQWEQLASKEFPSEDDGEQDEGQRGVDGAAGPQAALAIAEQRVTGALGEFANESEAISRMVESAVEGVSVRLQPRPTDGGEDRQVFEVSLHNVFRGFPRRDAVLLPIEMGGGLRCRDLVNHAQISPRTADSIKVKPEKKLAGDTAMHFGGFLDGKWRENDLLWGRLDAAEILVRAILTDDTAKRETVLEAVQEEILKAEKSKALAAPEGWKAYLADHAIGEAVALDLSHRRMTGLAIRAAIVLRGMVGVAAKGAPADSIRQRALLALGQAFDWASRLLYIPMKILRIRKLARETESPD